ncbi:hypothetical protein MBANPS3_005603 [Mucor bainieri]
MIPTALAILTYQILAILGTEAVTQIVTYIAYKRHDLDFKLMYTQSPLDLLVNYNRFDKKLRQKAAITVFVCLSIVLKFIPTIFTKISSTGTILYDTQAVAFDAGHVGKYLALHNDMPVFENSLVLNLAAQRIKRQELFQFIMKLWIGDRLNEDTVPNSTGRWFQLQPDFQPYAWDDRQLANPEGFGALDADSQKVITTFNAFGFRNGNQIMPSSATLQRCEDESRPGSHNAFDLTAIHGLQVSYVKSYDQVCYPVYDTSLSILVGRLNENDRNYRQLKLAPYLAHGRSSFGVSIINHNNTHMTMGVKKSAHLTLYSYNKTVTPPSNCSSEGKPDFANNFRDLPYNAVLCDLITHLNNASLQPAIVQAVGRRWIDNYVINTVYTIQRGNRFDSGDAVMIDFTMLQTFTVEGNSLNNKEYMVAYEERETVPGGSTPNSLSNDKIGYMLRELDPSNLDEKTIDIIVGLATMVVRFNNKDYSFLNLYQAQVMDAIDTPSWWVITVVALTIAFLLPQASRLMVKRIPEYSKDLRSLLLLTIGRTHVLGDVKSVNNVSLVVNEGLYQNKQDQAVLLAVNGHRITVGKKVEDNINTGLLDEEGDGSSSEQHLTDRQ